MEEWDLNPGSLTLRPDRKLQIFFSDKQGRGVWDMCLLTDGLSFLCSRAAVDRVCFSLSVATKKTCWWAVNGTKWMASDHGGKWVPGWLWEGLLFSVSSR